LFFSNVIIIDAKAEDIKVVLFEKNHLPEGKKALSLLEGRKVFNQRFVTLKTSREMR